MNTINKARMYFNEFKDIFSNPENHISTDGFDLLKELSQEDDSKQILKSISLHIDEYLLNNDICPECRQPLYYNSFQDNREYQGISCMETINQRYCKECGWQED